MANWESFLEWVKGQGITIGDAYEAVRDWKAAHPEHLPPVTEEQGHV